MRPRSKPSGEASLQRRIRAVRRVAFNSVLAATLGLVPAIAITATPAYAASGDLHITVSPSAAEGGTLTFHVVREGDADDLAATTVRASTGNAGDTATVADNDYTPLVNLQHAFPGTADDESFDFEVQTTGDSKYELDETITLTVTEVGNSANSVNEQGTITNNDALPTFSVAATPNPVGEEAGTTTARVTLSNPSYQGIVVPLAITPDTATTADYTPLADNASVTITAGALYAEQTVNITSDQLDEVNETFDVVAGGSVAPVGTDGNTANGDPSDTTTVTITDNDAQPTINLGAGVVEATEGDDLVFPVTLSAPSGQTVTVRAQTVSGGTATATDDFTPVVAQTLTFQPGDTTPQTPFTVPTEDDDTFENATETVNVSISAPLTGGALLGTTTTATGSITDAQAAPDLVVPDQAVAEPDNTTVQSALADVTLSGMSNAPIVVDYAIVADTATSADVTLGTGQLTFNAGSLTATTALNVSIIGDTIDENPNETFKITFSPHAGSVMGGGGAVGTAATITITDNDATPTFTLDAQSDAEGDSGATQVTYTVTLSNASSHQIDLAVTSADITAVEAVNLVGDDDFDVTNATVSIPPDSLTATFDVSIVGDTIYENAETATINVTREVGETDVAAGTQGNTLTITNDDTAPSVALNSESGSEGTNAAIDATVNGQSQLPFAVSVTAAGLANNGSNPADTGDFVNPSPYTLNVARGVTGAVTGTTFRLNNDTIDEPNETIKLTGVEHVTAYGVVVTPGWITINDDPGDLPPTVSIDDAVTVDEDNGTAEVAVTLSFDGDTTSTEQDVTAAYMTTDGSAVEGHDYTEETGTLTFTAGGSLAQDIVVDIEDDDLDEADQDFEVRLGAVTPSGTTKDNTVATVTITDDDATVAPVLNAPPFRYGVGYMGVGGVAREGATVQLWVTPVAGGAPQHVANTTADVDGHYRFVRWISQGYKVATKANSLLSTTKTVFVKQKPVMKLNSARPGMVNVFVTADPAQSGRSVLIQRWLNGQWRTVAARTTSSNGMTGATLIGQGSGKWVSYRAFVSGTPSLGILANYAVIQQIKVK